MIFGITCGTAFLCAKSYSNDCNNNSCKGNNNEMNVDCSIVESQLLQLIVESLLLLLFPFIALFSALTSDIRWIVKPKMLTVKSRVLTLYDQSKLMHRASPVRYRTITLAQR